MREIRDGFGVTVGINGASIGCASCARNTRAARVLCCDTTRVRAL